MVTVRAAMAWAALEDRGEVDPEALKTVAPLCVGHRTRGGGLEQPPTEEQLEEVISGAATRAWKAHSSTYFNPEETPKELQ
jgi:Mg-chelatase subunit ChlI